jgi:uncharacterized protein YndB with AHSA1/START domain
MSFGTLETTDQGASQLRFTRELAHPLERVWRALSEPEHLLKWFPTTIEGDRTAGAPLVFSFPGGQAPPFEGEMISWEPPHLIEFKWGPDVIRIELRRTGADTTTLTLLDTLDEHGKAARDGTGWHNCLDALDRALDGDDDAREELNRWQDLHGEYVDRFGPDAATIGVPPEFDATANAER